MLDINLFRISQSEPIVWMIGCLTAFQFKIVICLLWQRRDHFFIISHAKKNMLIHKQAPSDEKGKHALHSI